MTDFLFSIITITRNNVTGLKKTSASLDMQNLRDFEWLVVDGASGDGTKKFLKSTEAEWTSEPDKNLYDAMNKGIKRAKGTYILFLNAGDQLAHHDTLEQVQKNAGADLIYGDSLEGKKIEQAKYKKARSWKAINRGLFTHHQAIFYKTALINDLRYDLSYKIAADYDFTRKFLLKTQSIKYIAKPLCLFEPGGISQQEVKKARKEQYEIRKKDGVPFYWNALIYNTQTCSYAIRRFFPKLYWFLKDGG